MTHFVDTTLRDGCQAPSALLSDAERADLAFRLAEAGFTELEAGIPARGKDEVEFLRSLVATGVRVLPWCRATEEDLRAAALTGSGAVHISGTLNALQLGCLGKERAEMEGAMLGLLRRAKRSFDFVSIGLMDACRTDDDILRPFIAEALALGADRVRLADSVGTATPHQVMRWAGEFAAFLPRLEFHAHNDLGMATATAVTAALSGFGAVSATVAGIGERAGNACWEEVATALRHSGAATDTIDLGRLFALSLRLRACLDESVPDRQPLLGAHAFAHESGLHVSAQGRDDLAFQFCRPQDIGLPTSRFLFGPQSGAAGLIAVLGGLGFEIGRDRAARLLERVRDLSLERRRALEPEEVADIARAELARARG
jgi:homocitrate synthase NifV